MRLLSDIERKQLEKLESEQIEKIVNQLVYSLRNWLFDDFPSWRKKLFRFNSTRLLLKRESILYENELALVFVNRIHMLNGKQVRVCSTISSIDLDRFLFSLEKAELIEEIFLGIVKAYCPTMIEKYTLVRRENNYWIRRLTRREIAKQIGAANTCS